MMKLMTVGHKKINQETTTCDNKGRNPVNSSTLLNPPWWGGIILHRSLYTHMQGGMGEPGLTWPHTLTHIAAEPGGGAAK